MTAVGAQTYRYQVYQKLTCNIKKETVAAGSPLFAPVSPCVAALWAG